MQYLNLPLSFLRSPEYIGSAPVERGTWLNVLAYCCDQENGGRIVGAARWKDRQWQQSCGVTSREVRSATRLIEVDGDDVIVHGYPTEKEAEVRARRIQAADAANRRWAKRVGLPADASGNAPRIPLSSAPDDAGADATAHAQRNAEENRKRKEGPAPGAHVREAGTDSDDDAPVATGPTLADVEAEFARCSGGTPVMAGKFHGKWSAVGWTDGRSPIRNWRALVPSYVAEWLNVEGRRAAARRQPPEGGPDHTAVGRFGI